MSPFAKLKAREHKVDHLEALRKFTYRLAGDIPADERARLETVTKVYQRLYVPKDHE